MGEVDGRSYIVSYSDRCWLWVMLLRFDSSVGKIKHEGSSLPIIVSHKFDGSFVVWAVPTDMPLLPTFPTWPLRLLHRAFGAIARSVIATTVDASSG